MTNEEKSLIDTLNTIKDVLDRHMAAIILQNYIQENGLISTEAGEIIKDLLRDV